MRETRDRSDVVAGGSHRDHAITLGYAGRRKKRGQKDTKTDPEESRTEATVGTEEVLAVCRSAANLSPVQVVSHQLVTAGRAIRNEVVTLK